MIGIVLLNYNNFSDTRACIESLLRMPDQSEWKLFLVDNHSRIDEHTQTLDYIRGLCDKFLYIEDWKSIVSEQEYPKYVYVRTDSNLGYGNGNNVALRLMSLDASIDYVMVLNTDVLFTEPILTPMRMYLEGHPKVAMVAPLLYGRHGEIDLSCARNIKNLHHFISMVPGMRHIGSIRRKAMSNYLDIKKLDMTHPIKTELITGACFMVPMKLFEEIGFFDPHTFLYYEEDILGVKVRERGMECCLLPNVSLIHLGANSSQDIKSTFLQKCRIESMAYYLRNYSSFNRIIVEALILFYKVSYYTKKILGE